MLRRISVAIPAFIWSLISLYGLNLVSGQTSAGYSSAEQFSYYVVIPMMVTAFLFVSFMYAQKMPGWLLAIVVTFGFVLLPIYLFFYLGGV